MKGGFKVVDCSRHVVEPRDLWGDRAEIGASRLDAITVRGRPAIKQTSNFFEHPAYQELLRGAVEADFSAASNLADMDRQGIDAAVLLPTLGCYALWADHVGPDLSVPMAQAYNDWLRGYCQADAARLKGVALLPLQDPKAAAAELRRAVRDLGLVAGLLLPNPIVGRKLQDKGNDPLYAEAASLGVPLIVTQAGSGMAAPQIGRDRFPALFAREAAVDPFEAWIALGSLMGHNVLERFPGLKIGFVGAGCGWLPFWLERLEEHWGGFFGRDASSSQPPDILFRSQGFAACDPWEKTLPEVIEEVGDRTIVWGSQYPLPDVLNFFPNELDVIVNDSHLSQQAKQRLLWDNAADLFGFA
jgi:predicted TIM-barrel fold metal-dependent hydrolase